MLYIVRVFEDDFEYEYEYGNIMHALEQYAHEKTADIVAYDHGNEKVVRRKVDNNEHEEFLNDHIHSLWAQKVRC